jgi:peptidoglycan hydrolase-like protein with peptidoglycan-binding domain
VSFWGRVGRQSTTLARNRGITATAGAAAVVLIAGGAFAASSHGSGPASASGHETVSNASDTKPLAHVKPAKPLKLVSVTPGKNATDVNGADPIKVTFSTALSPSTPLPRLSPDIAGSWHVSGEVATFTPQVGFLPATSVTVNVPSGMRAAVSSSDVLKTTSEVHFTTGSYSTLRLQQLLTQLGYLPFDWTPSDTATGDIPDDDASGQLAAAYDAPAGTFKWNASYPSQLTSQWVTGESNMLVTGAIRAFEYNQGLTMDGDAGPEVWSHLLTAIAKDQKNPNGYTYALATQGSSNESLQVWHNGKQILDSPANTGIAAAPTQDGTYPVYERLQFQDMQGTNPDGSHYDDPVYWISYFNGGDAIHGFVRGSYGFYQSLGCVELPVTTAQSIWPSLTYGTLVTVQGPVA